MPDFDAGRLRVNEIQLKLLTDVQNFTILALFLEPRNPSDAARVLNMPANTLHYRINRLAEAGLLQVVSQKGRRRTYQTATTKFRVHRSLLPMMDENLPAQLNIFLGKLQRRFIAEVERKFSNHANFIRNEEADGYVNFDLTGQPIVTPYLPVARFSEIRLNKERYTWVMQVLIELLEAVEKEPDSEGEVCTLTIIAYRGRVGGS